MRALFLRYGLKHHLGHKFRLAMVLMSLALGVAIFVSSFESVSAAETSIAASADSLSSKAEWDVSRGRYLGVEESLVDQIRRETNAIAAPVIEATAITVGPNPSNFLVIGVDLDSDSGSKLLSSTSQVDLTPFIKLRLSGTGIVLSKVYADRNSLKEGSSVTLQTSQGRKALLVAGILADKKLAAVAGGNLGFMEIHEAQRAFGKPGIVDKIEVAGVSKPELLRICPTCQIDKPGRLSSAAEDALGRIRSLLGVSMIALLAGVLLIYNAVQVSVLERLQDIAILRAIGATRVQIFTLLLVEWLLIGLVGAAAGVALGSGLAIALLDYTKRTVNTMVPLVVDAKIDVSLPLILAALAIGTLTALAAAFFPAWTAANVRPLDVLRPYSYRRSKGYRASAVVGIVLFVLSNIVIAVQGLSYLVGLCLTGVEFLGIALLFPQVVLTVGNWIRAPFRRLPNPAPYLALDGLMKAPHRAAFTMMTFGCALMITIATETLVGGFRASTGMWMNSAFPFDISVMGNDLASSVYGSQVLPKSLAGKLRQIPGVQNVYSVRKLFTPFQGHDVMAIGVDMDRYIAARKRKSMGMWPPELRDPKVLADYRSGRGTFVSSNFAQLYGVHTGDDLPLDTPTGAFHLKVLGQVDDYSWQHGCFILDMAVLESRWKDDGISYIDLSAASGYSVRDVKQRVQNVIAVDRSAFAYDKQEIKDVTDSVLEQAVAMANMQAVIGLLIGVLGIVNAIWIGVMNRKREIAMWRAIGLTKRQIGAIILFEGLFISSVAAIVGCVGGLYGGWVPLRAFSFAVTGYLYPLVVPWHQLLFETVLAITLGLLAGLIPAWQATKLPILDSISYE